MGGAFSAYGMQSIPAGGNTTDSPIFANSYIVDVDGISGQSTKGALGEVDRYETICDCLETAVHEVICPTEPGGSFQVEMDVTNNSGQTGAFWLIAPCPSADLRRGW